MSEQEKKLSLSDRLKEFTLYGVPFMDGAEKGAMSELFDREVTIEDYGFLPDGNGEVFVVLAFVEEPKKFFFGGKVLSDNLAQLDAEGYGEEIRKNGIRLKLTQRKSKKGGRTYTAVEYL